MLFNVYGQHYCQLVSILSEPGQKVNSKNLTKMIRQ